MKSIALVLILALSVYSTQGQVMLRVDVLNDTIGYYEPLFIKVTIYNPTDEELSIDPFVYSKYQFRKMGMKDWKVLPLSLQFDRNCPEPIISDTYTPHRVISESITFQAREQKIDTYIFLQESGNKLEGFDFNDNSESCEIRLQKCFKSMDDGCIFSSKDTIQVIRYSAKEQEAISWLKKQSLLHILYEPFLNRDLTFCNKSELPDFLPKVEEFYQLFPYSRFAVWVKYYHAYWIWYYYYSNPNVTLDEKMYQKARGLFFDIIKQTSNSYLKQKAMDILFEVRLRLGEKDPFSHYDQY